MKQARKQTQREWELMQQRGAESFSDHARIARESIDTPATTGVAAPCGCYDQNWEGIPHTVGDHDTPTTGVQERIKTMKQFVFDNSETPITLENAAFMFCKDLPAVKALDVHEHKQIQFQSGMGTTVVKVTRVPDTEEAE